MCRNPTQGIDRYPTAKRSTRCTRARSCRLPTGPNSPAAKNPAVAGASEQVSHDAGVVVRFREEAGAPAVAREHERPGGPPARQAGPRRSSSAVAASRTRYCAVVPDVDDVADGDGTGRRDRSGAGCGRGSRPARSRACARRPPRRGARRCAADRGRPRPAWQPRSWSSRVVRGLAAKFVDHVLLGAGDRVGPPDRSAPLRDHGLRQSAPWPRNAPTAPLVVTVPSSTRRLPPGPDAADAWPPMTGSPG